MFGSPYYTSAYNPQQTKERIDNQIAQLQQMKDQLPQVPVPQPTNLTQNFQISPTNQGAMKYVNSIDDVHKELVFGDTPFFSKDLSVLWIKNAKGEIKAYTLAEIVQKDEKDLQIEFLQAQIEELKKGMINDESSNEYDYESVESKESSSTKAIRGNKKK